MIKCRIIVKKIGKHTGGGEADIFEKLYKQREFTEEDRKRIKAEMFIQNNIIDDSEINYEAYNLSAKIKELVANGANVNVSFGNPEYFKLGKNDPILHFFPKSEFNIEFDSNDIGRMKLNYINSDKRRCNIYYEFTGDEDSFELHIYNLRSCFDALTKEDASLLVYYWEEYIKFLRKLYPRAISYEFYYDVPSSNNRNNRIGILEVPFENYSREFSSNELKKYKVRVGLDFYKLFTKKSPNSNSD